MQPLFVCIFYFNVFSFVFVYVILFISVLEMYFFVNSMFFYVKMVVNLIKEIYSFFERWKIMSFVFNDAKKYMKKYL